MHGPLTLERNLRMFVMAGKHASSIAVVVVQCVIQATDWPGSGRAA